MIPIRPDRKYFVPVMNGERQFYLSSRTDHGAKFNAVLSENIAWEELVKQDWKIETYWGSEYE